MNENEFDLQQWLSEIDLILEQAENETHKCAYCGKEFTGEYIELNGEIYCDDCREEHIYICDYCGELVLDDDAHFYRDRLYCNHCIETLFETCVDCGALVRRCDAYEIAWGAYICENCYEDNYRYCADCDCLHHIANMIYDDFDGEYYCESCYHDRRGRVIHDYGYKPLPIFHGAKNYENALYMGVELEIDKGGEDSDNAQILLDTMNADAEHIYIKHDGSINNGFEIVSHPATLDYHINKMNWSKLMEKALSMGYRSHDTETCGLHVHVSRMALGDTYDECENTIAKIVYFIENNWDCIVKFTRRNERNISRWANRYGIEDSILNTYDKAKRDYNRYRALNLLNDNTIEFRIFRGTLKHETFIATLQFVQNVCNVCMNLSMDELIELDWNSFVTYIPDDHAQLVNYLKIRNLY